METGPHAAGGLLHDRLLLGPAGVAHPKLEHEAVELRLGQRIGAFLLDRILGGQHEEGVRQVVGGAAGGDLMLLHRLKQGRLGLRWCPVDLVGQHHVGEDRTLHEAERAPCRW